MLLNQRPDGSFTNWQKPIYVFFEAQK